MAARMTCYSSRDHHEGATSLSTFVIEFATRSGVVVPALEGLRGVNVTTERNMTGELVVAASILVPITTVLIKEVFSVIRSHHANILAQKLKIGKGTISFEGLSTDDICLILERLRELDIK
jgi:hypothetical protein